MDGFASRILRNLSAPHYRHNPRQLLIRALRAVRPPRSSMEVVRLPWGVPIRLNPREFVGNSIWFNGVYDLAVSEATWRLLDPGDVAVDAGANIGYVTSIMALRVAPTGKVIAFEPHPDVFRTLTENARGFAEECQIGQITALNVALGMRSGCGILVTGDEWSANQGLARVLPQAEPDPSDACIEVRSLDDAMGDTAIALFKVDVEGQERDVLLGAERLFSARRINTVIYEDHVGEDSETHVILRAAGFTVCLLDRDDSGIFLAPTTASRKSQEAPNFIAMLDPAEVGRRFAEPGWKIFRKSRRVD